MTKTLRFNVSISIILLCTVLLSGIILVSSNSSATSASTATASVKVAASCTLTTTGGGNYSATVPNGTSAEIAGSTMSVSCNDAGGFALYAVGYSNDTVGNNNMIGQSTNIATNTSGTDSYWAMKINPTSGNTPTIENSFNNYHIVPDIHTKVASYASSTGTGSLSVNATYKANISSTQLAGNYLGKVKYTLVHPANEVPPHEVACEARRICYNANTNIVEGQMGKENTYNNTSVTLWAPNFKRDGYGFAGWSDKYDYETNTDAHFYGPQETIATPSDIQTNGLSLYAVWIESQGILQNWDCESIEFGTTTALTDARDGNTYAVAKLADGKCWMIENLRLDDSAILTPFNTHNPLLPLTNTDGTTSNHLSSTTDPTQTAWCATSSSVCVEQSMLATNDTTLFANNTSSSYNTTSNVYGYGNHYNWYSATAAHSKNALTSSSDFNAPGDICPKSWFLPKGGDKSRESTNDFWELIVNGINDGVKPVNYNDNSRPYYSGAAEEAYINTLRSYPNNFIYSGYVWGSTISSRNAEGFYLSASSNATGSVHVTRLNSDSVYPGTILYSSFIGGSVRCFTLPSA